MKKTSYFTPVLTVTLIANEDVLTTSGLSTWVEGDGQLQGSGKVPTISWNG